MLAQNQLIAAAKGKGLFLKIEYRIAEDDILLIFSPGWTTKERRVLFCNEIIPLKDMQKMAMSEFYKNVIDVVKLKLEKIDAEGG